MTSSQKYCGKAISVKSKNCTINILANRNKSSLVDRPLYFSVFFFFFFFLWFFSSSYSIEALLFSSLLLYTFKVETLPIIETSIIPLNFNRSHRSYWENAASEVKATATPGVDATRAPPTAVTLSPWPLSSTSGSFLSTLLTEWFCSCLLSVYQFRCSVEWMFQENYFGIIYLFIILRF